MKTLVLANTHEKAITRDIVRELKARKHEVFTVASIEDALKSYDSRSPQIVVTTSLDEYALSLCRHVSAHSAELTVTILMVVESEKGERLPETIAAGADDYVLSPMEPERLRIRLDLAEKRVRDQESRKAVERELEARVRQQACVSHLGLSALDGAGPDEIMKRAVRAVAEGLDVKYVKVLELKHDPDRLIMRAGMGWGRGRIGKADSEPGRGSQAGYTLVVNEPVVVEDFKTEQRFQPTPLILEHKITSSVSVVVARGSVPYGVLIGFDKRRRHFGIEDVHFMQAVANVVGAVIERRHSEEALRESEAKARAIVETTVDAIITIDMSGRIESFNSAAERIFQFDSEEVIGQNVRMLMPSPYHEEHDGYLRSYRETGRRQIIGIGREVLGLRKDGSVFPMELAVSEVALNGRRMFTGIIRDISERRRLEQEILEISEQERRRIGQDLHDGLGQMLTGIGLITQNLAKKLKADSVPAADDLFEITELVKEADQHARGLARGLIPVELDAKGLAAALRRFVTHAERLFGVRCRFEELGTALLYDNTTATHLYRIVQESVNNAVKHGRAKRITIRLASGEDQIRVRIHDDGVGFPSRLPEQQGMGVRIMQHRARMIGGSLEIQRPPAGGTVIVCTVPRRRISASPIPTFQEHRPE